MHSSLLALVASVSVASAVTRGFNYGAVTRTGETKNQAAFTAEFNAAKGLAGTDGAFTAARLYTTVQAGTQRDPISAIPAAIATNTKLFLGMWASSGSTIINDEIAALEAAVKLYGTEFTSRVTGISVGSEDLYRISPTGLSNDPLGVGAQPNEVANYIKQVKDSLAKLGLSIPVGHVDTWDVWQNGSNSAVVAASDFLGMNTFPYFQTTQDNSIENAGELFNAAYDITVRAANGKPVLVTETGWPVKGKESARASPSTTNARSYYETVGCNTLFGKIDTYWYTLVDANTDTASQPQFGVVGTQVGTTPLFDLSCSAKNTTSSSSSSSATASSSGTLVTSASTATGTGGSVTILPTGSVTPGAEAGRPAPTAALAGGNGTTVGPTGGAGGAGGAGPRPTTVAPGATGTGAPFAGAATQMKVSLVGGLAVVAAVMALA